MAKQSKIKIINGIEHKQCSKNTGCGEYLPVTKFKQYDRIDKQQMPPKRIPYLSSMCMPCEREYNNARRRVDTESTDWYACIPRLRPDWTPEFITR